MVIGHHIILTGYAHWLPNDPRGSMSLEVYSPKLAELAQVHFGRKKKQPSREELRAFYREAREYLAYQVLWFDDAERQAITDAIGRIIEREKLTCYACAVLTNHVHLLMRKHRLSSEHMLGAFKDGIRGHLQTREHVPADHPVFSADHRVLFKSTTESVRRCITYIAGNPRKHGLPPQEHDFVAPYDNWPFHRKLREPGS